MSSPFNYNPLKGSLAETINFERVRTQQAVKLFVSAANVQTAKVNVFHGKDIGLEQILASACLLLMTQAVEVDGQYYWDGSFTGNPAIFPLYHDCQRPTKSLAP
jgi:NTE family protein